MQIHLSGEVLVEAANDIHAQQRSCAECSCLRSIESSRLEWQRMTTFKNQTLVGILTEHSGLLHHKYMNE